MVAGAHDTKKATKLQRIAPVRKKYCALKHISIVLKYIPSFSAVPGTLYIGIVFSYLKSNA